MVAANVPPGETTVVGDVKTVISYSRNEQGQLVKTTKKYKVESKKDEVIAARRVRRSSIRKNNKNNL